MTTQALIDYCAAKPGASLYCPFGPEPLCARAGKRIFAEIFLTRPWITLKCEPAYGLAMRAAYPANIRRGYHCPTPQQPYNNTVTLDGAIPDELLTEMIDHSYARVLKTMRKEERNLVSADTPETPGASDC